MSEVIKAEIRKKFKYDLDWQCPYCHEHNGDEVNEKKDMKCIIVVNVENQ